MNYDLITTLCGLIVAAMGTVALDENDVFSPGIQTAAKVIAMLATSAGFYFTNKAPKVTPPAKLTAVPGPETRA